MKTLKKHWVDILFIVLVILATTVAWHGILAQSIEGEGFFYFSPELGRIKDFGQLIKGMENFGLIIQMVSEFFFKGNIQPYMTLIFSTIILVNVSFYLCVKKITKNSFLALVAALYSGINYTGDFQFYARGHWQWFLQRVPEMFIILPSFVNIFRYIETQKNKYYFLSLTFFTLSVFLEHFSSLFLPFFPSLMLVAALTMAKRWKNRLKYLALSLPFIAINYFLISRGGYYNNSIAPIHPLGEFLSHPIDIISKVSIQLVIVTIPFSFFIERLHEVKNFASLLHKLAFPTYTFYLGCIWLLYKKKSANFTLVASCFLALLGVLSLNVYLGRFIIENNVLQGRYYYTSAFYVGIIFACLLNSLREKISNSRSKRVKIVTDILIYLIIFVWFFKNTKLIWKQIQARQYLYTGARVLMQHLNKVKSTLPENSIVILPSPLMPSGIAFLNKYYSGKNTKFLFLDKKWLSFMPNNFNSKNLFVFNYSTLPDNKVKLIDLSEEYRKQLPKNK